MSAVLNEDVPATNIDPFDDAILNEPYATFRAWRDAGPVLWCKPHGVWLMTRYHGVKQALTDHETFLSGEGVGLYPPAVEALRGTVIASDPPEHTPLRKVLSGRMSAVGIKALQKNVEAEADKLVEALIERRTFDAVKDMAQKFPMMIVAELIGLPEEGREQLLEWADCGFNTFGPGNARTLRSMPKFEEMLGYIMKLDADPSVLRPGSFGREIYEAAERNEIRPDQCGRLMAAFLMAGLDTTISSLANTVWLFGRHPEQWDIVRANPSLVPLAYNEILRFESPAQAFRRTLARDVDIESVTMRAGDAVVLLYGSANRDERYWKNADQFDVRRRENGHLALGFGLHNCAGQGLARLEAHALMNALARRVERFEIGRPKRHLNNVIRSLESLPVTLAIA